MFQLKRHRSWLVLLVASSCLLAGAVDVGRAEDGQPDRFPPDALPVADPVHADLEALVANGTLELPSLYSRPLLRFDVARALAQALETHPERASEPTMQRALEEFDTELARLEGTHPERSQLIDIADDDSWLRGELFWRGHAEVFPGRGAVLTDSTRLGLRFSWMVWPGLHLFSETYAAQVANGSDFGDPLFSGTDVILFQDRVYAGLDTRYAQVVVGRDRLAWGPGWTGSLLLSETARPFTQLRLSRSFFDGRLHATIVNGVLNQHERRFVAFHRLEWQALPSLRIGLAEGARYNSDNAELLYLVGVIPYPIVGRLLERDNEDRQNDEAVRNNVMWGVDAVWRHASGIGLYGEMLVDDIGVEEDDHPTRLAYQLGFVHQGHFWGRSLRLRFEWTRVWNFVYSTFYGADFEHEGVALGYPLGPDSRALHARGDWVWNRDWTLTGSLERLDRGEGALGAPWRPNDPELAGVNSSVLSGVVETQWHARVGARFSRGRLEVLGEAGPGWIQNADHVAGRTERGLVGRAAVGMRY